MESGAEMQQKTYPTHMVYHLRSGWDVWVVEVLERASEGAEYSAWNLRNKIHWWNANAKGPLHNTWKYHCGAPRRWTSCTGAWKPTEMEMWGHQTKKSMWKTKTTYRNHQSNTKELRSHTLVTETWSSQPKAFEMEAENLEHGYQSLEPGEESCEPLETRAPTANVVSTPRRQADTLKLTRSTNCAETGPRTLFWFLSHSFCLVCGVCFAIFWHLSDSACLQIFVTSCTACANRSIRISSGGAGESNALLDVPIVMPECNVEMANGLKNCLDVLSRVTYLALMSLALFALVENWTRFEISATLCVLSTITLLSTYLQELWSSMHL